jgi:hypothetical protein
MAIFRFGMAAAALGVLGAGATALSTYDATAAATAATTLASNTVDAGELPGTLEVGGDLRYRYEGTENRYFNINAANNNPFKHLARLRLYADYSTDDYRVFFMPQVHWQERIESMSIVNDDTAINQAYIDFEEENLDVRLGRQPIDYGSRRLLANVGWGNEARTWDAGRLRLNSDQATTDIFYGRKGFWKFTQDNPALFGIWSVLTPENGPETDLYALYRVVQNPRKDEQVWAFGARPQFQLDERWFANLEVVGQVGSYGSRDLQAYGYVLRVGYDEPSGWKPGFHVDFAYGSGGDPDDPNRVTTLDPFYPSNFGRYSVIGFEGWRNTRALTLCTHVKPSDKSWIKADISKLDLADPRDFWYGAGGSPIMSATGVALRDPTGNSGRDIGWEFNVRGGYEAFEGFEVSAGFSQFHPGDFVKNTNNGFSDTVRWFYLQTTYDF